MAHLPGLDAPRRRPMPRPAAIHPAGSRPQAWLSRASGPHPRYGAIYNSFLFLHVEVLSTLHKSTYKATG